MVDTIHCGVPAARRQACPTMHTQAVNGPDEDRVLSVRFQVAMLPAHGRSGVSIERDGLGIQAPKAGKQAGRQAGNSVAVKLTGLSCRLNGSTLAAPSHTRRL